VRLQLKQINNGFTLLEVLVALSVLAIALAAAIKISIENAENTRYLRDKTFAHWIAMNILADIQIRQKLPILKKGSSIMAKRKWYWRVKIANTTIKDLKRIDIEVWQNDVPLVILVGFLEFNMYN
jgi:general secretion pathway protein I